MKIDCMKCCTLKDCMKCCTLKDKCLASESYSDESVLTGSSMVHKARFSKIRVIYSLFIVIISVVIAGRS